MRIGILGYGAVGKAVSQLSVIFDVAIYDPGVEKYNSVQAKISALSANFVFCCVPTDGGPEGGLNLSIVDSCLAEFKKYSSPDAIFVIKSTVTPGATQKFCEKYSTHRILMNPEFLTQRTADQDFRTPTDVVIGGDLSVGMQLVQMYDAFYHRDGDPFFYSLCTATEAELTKVVRNSFFAVKVSFMNEVYELCERMGSSYETFREVLTNKGQHPWIHGQHTFVPGPDGKFGYGGKCLPKDSKDLLNLASWYGVSMRVLGASIETNERHRRKTKGFPSQIWPEPSPAVSFAKKGAIHV